MLRVSSNSFAERAPGAAPPSLDDARRTLLGRDAYVGYAYAYPHKTSYRPIEPGSPLRSVWKDEAVEALSLYVHVPFCSTRCGYCNLLSVCRPAPALVEGYLSALERQIEAVAAALPAGRRVARLALGGGTPTFLSPTELVRVFDLLKRHLDASPHDIPSCVEISAHSADRDRLAMLRALGVDRISLGAQTFSDRDAAALGRRQTAADLHRALNRVRELGFPTLNIDLIYGARGQTTDSWLESIDQALQYRSEEIYLYPLYVRQLTGLGRRQSAWSDDRLALYRAGRARLLAAGYTQRSMRMFALPIISAPTGPDYCCQEDGMVGLGPGARSYTRSLHYATEYAVGQRATRDLVAAYSRLSREDLSLARYGIRLDGQEQRRRYVIKSVLRSDGLSLEGYEGFFGTSLFDDQPALHRLIDLGLLERTSSHLVPTALGLERSDAIGPWLYSPRVNQFMEAYEWC